MNVIALVGLETIKDQNGNVKFFADTFLDNIKTWHHDNPKKPIKIFDARNYKDTELPIQSIFKDISEYSKNGIDIFLYSGHSDPDALYIISKVRKELEDKDRFITKDTDWSVLTFNKGAIIKLMGCQAGGQDNKKWPDCIAQTIADKTKTKVLAFTCKSSQHQKNGGYYQIPDSGGYVEFTAIGVVK